MCEAVVVGREWLGLLYRLGAVVTGVCGTLVSERGLACTDAAVAAAVAVAAVAAPPPAEVAEADAAKVVVVGTVEAVVFEWCSCGGVGSMRDIVIVLSFIVELTSVISVL
jgi:hypothetical protein